jgi:hypothetical protein
MRGKQRRAEPMFSMVRVEDLVLEGSALKTKNSEAR